MQFKLNFRHGDYSICNTLLIHVLSRCCMMHIIRVVLYTHA